MFTFEWDNATLINWYEYLDIQWSLNQLDNRSNYEAEDEDSIDI